MNACRKGERALIFSYEESADQLIRNMNSIGLKLAPLVSKKLLRIHAARPSLQGLEQHLVAMYDDVVEFEPSVVVVDPVSNLSQEDTISAMPTLVRLIDMLKQKQITGIFTSLTNATSSYWGDSEVGISSLMDTWLLLRNDEADDERNRTIFVLKSRGMPHSNKVRGFLITDKGVRVTDQTLPEAR